MTKEELTWIAAVFDCEGCISSQKSKYIKRDGTCSNNEYVVIQIGHCSLDLIERYHKLVGMGKLYGHKYDYSYRNVTERKQVYWWKITKHETVLEFIELIWDEWLSEYRRETIINLGVAPMATKRKHTHQYHRTYPFAYKANLSSPRHQWACAIPDCTHFLPRNMEEPIGKLSICNNCMETFVLDEENMKFDKPVCSACTNLANGTVVSEDIALERHIAKSTIASRTGRTLDEVSETEVDRFMQFQRLKDI